MLWHPGVPGTGAFVRRPAPPESRKLRGSAPPRDRLPLRGTGPRSETRRRPRPPPKLHTHVSRLRHTQRYHKVTTTASAQPPTVAPADLNRPPPTRFLNPLSPGPGPGPPSLPRSLLAQKRERKCSGNPLATMLPTVRSKARGTFGAQRSVGFLGLHGRK